MIIQEQRVYPIFRIQPGGELKSAICHQSKALVFKKNDTHVTFVYLPISLASQVVIQPIDVFVQAVEICLNAPKSRASQTHFERSNWPELSLREGIKSEYNYRRELDKIRFGLYREPAWISDHVMVSPVASLPIAKKEVLASLVCSGEFKRDYPSASRSFRILGEKDGCVYFRFTETARKTQQLIADLPSTQVLDVSWDVPFENREIVTRLAREILHDDANSALKDSLIRASSSEQVDQD